MQYKSRLSFLSVSARLSMKIWKSALFYIFLPVCVRVFVCMCLCVFVFVCAQHLAFELQLEQNSQTLLPAYNSHQHTLCPSHSLSLSLPLSVCFPRVLVELVKQLLFLASYCQCTPAHLPAVRDNAVGATFGGASLNLPHQQPPTRLCSLLTGPIYYVPCLPYTFAADAAALVAHISLSSLFILPPFSILIQRAAHAAFPLLFRLLLLLLHPRLRCWRVCPCACFGTHCPPARLSACRLSPLISPPSPAYYAANCLCLLTYYDP